MTTMVAVSGKMLLYRTLGKRAHRKLIHGEIWRIEKGKLSAKNEIFVHEQYTRTRRAQFSGVEQTARARVIHQA